MLARGLEYTTNAATTETNDTTETISFLDKIDKNVDSAFVYEHFARDLASQKNICTVLNIPIGEYSALKAAQYLRQFIRKEKLSWEKVSFCYNCFSGLYKVSYFQQYRGWG